MKKETIVLICRLLLIFAYIVAVAIIFLMLPKYGIVGGIFEKIKIWFAIAAIGVTGLNFYGLKFVLKLKEGVSVWDVFTTWGRAKIAQNPDAYFLPEDYKEYRGLFKFGIIYMVVAMIALLAIASSR